MESIRHSLSACLLCIILFIPQSLHAANDYQPYTIPEAHPTDYTEIERVLDEAGGDPKENIPANLEQALCGGWDLNISVNGVYGQEEPFCPPSVDEPIGAKCPAADGTIWTKIDDNTWSKGERVTMSDADMDNNAKRTIKEAGLIPRVENVPGRDTARAFGNIRSGFGMRRENDGDAEDLQYDPNAKVRITTNTYSGFDYPKDDATTCGFTTVCRPPQHPDERTLPPAGYRTSEARRDLPNFFCEHACQRPLDDNGKPKNWDETDSTVISCGAQEIYTEETDGIQYACGGKQTKGPGEDFCGELNSNGPLAGLCQDLNSWVYIRWQKLVHICIDPDQVTGAPVIPVPIYRYEKGSCGFPEEVDTSEESDGRREDNWEVEGFYECCSDARYSGNTYDQSYRGESCIPCTGDDCRFYDTDNDGSADTKNVIINDEWLEPFPSSLQGRCRVDPPTDPDEIEALREALIAIGIDPDDPPVNIGRWDDPDTNLDIHTEGREYISYFREYMNGGYERSDVLQSHATSDDYKKQNIPVACYGMYDLAPEDAKTQKIQDSDKRCVIAGYYHADDGDGQETNFWNMKLTQSGKGFLRIALDDNPFLDAAREFIEDTSLWWPRLEGDSVTLNGFSMINDQVFDETYNNDLSMTLLTTDNAAQRATVQLDPSRPLSSGALIRTPDDTITIENDDRKDRRTIVEWWHQVSTEMYRDLTLPTVHMLIPSAWSIDLDPLDPLLTPPAVPSPDDLPEDIRSESIEIQVQAREDLLGDIAGFLERALLLRTEETPVPVVVPIVNPTELRAIAQGWETWARKQEKEGYDGVTEARDTAKKLQEYADRADDVRALRAELPRYIGAVLNEQHTIRLRIAEWLEENIDKYKTYREQEADIVAAKQVWQNIQLQYRALHDDSGFPWCSNERFTVPMYSLLDPWLPGRENNGDTTGGMQQFAQCKNDVDKQKPRDCGGGNITTCAPSCALIESSPFAEEYLYCLSYVSASASGSAAGSWESFDPCDQFYPTPVLLPQIPQVEHYPDMLLDFTAFRESPQAIALPVLKPVQLRINFREIQPPPLEQDEEPSSYPKLAPLPAFPDELSDTIADGMPYTIELEDTLPEITLPEIDTLSIIDFLGQAFFLVQSMKSEYDKFWNSVTMERCDDGAAPPCVRPGTEQDCIRPYNDPKRKCVHFEADLNERFQRLGARPAIFLSDDFRALGNFRDPMTHGQKYCEREDWSCQLLNALVRKPREGWLTERTEDEESESFIHDIRTQVREESSNIFDTPDKYFHYDIRQEQMFENFNVPISASGAITP